jgi:hypothetical protein
MSSFDGFQIPKSQQHPSRDKQQTAQGRDKSDNLKIEGSQRVGRQKINRKGK